ncbi:MAG: hypothetical protein VW437_00955 [Betaproteobacteria bacterium]
MSNIKIVEVSPDKIIPIWESSPHASVFIRPDVLTRMADDVRWFIARKGDEVLSCWPVCHNDDGEMELPLFSYFVGPFWTDRGWSVPLHRSLHRRLTVYEEFMSQFELLFGGFVCSLPVGHTDVRPFDWWNYHRLEKNRVEIFPRYTARIHDLCGMKNPALNYRAVRRQEIRKIEEEKSYKVIDQIDLDSIVDLYVATMARQNEVVSDRLIKAIKALYELSETDTGFIIAVSDSLTNHICYIGLLLRASGISNLVLSLTDDRYRKSGVTAFGINEAIKKSIWLGDNIFDFNGANSPKRGDDKHSYGAEDILYFDVRYRA